MSSAEDAEENPDEEPVVIKTVWGVSCPLASYCRSSMFKQTRSWMFHADSEEACKKRIISHLKYSPYHELSQDEAESLAVWAPITSWEEPEKKVKRARIEVMPRPKPMPRQHDSHVVNIGTAGWVEPLVEP